jgi:hypothetical protein
MARFGAGAAAVPTLGIVLILAISDYRTSATQRLISAVQGAFDRSWKLPFVHQRPHDSPNTTEWWSERWWPERKTGLAPIRDPAEHVSVIDYTARKHGIYT